MILIRLFFAIVMIFTVLVATLGLAFLLRIRAHLQSPFLRQNHEPPNMPNDGKTIEGQFQVVEPENSDSTKTPN
jgi:hypothetical protein